MLVLAAAAIAALPSTSAPGANSGVSVQAIATVRVISGVRLSFGPDQSLITRDATFEQLDIDSLDLVELAQIVEDEYGVELKGDDVKDVKTVGEVIDLVVAKAS